MTLNAKQLMEHVLRLKNNITEIKFLPAYVNTIGNSLALSKEDLDNLNLVIEEAVSNIILYAYPQHEEHCLELRANCIGRELTLYVIDEGIPFNPTESITPDTKLSMEDRTTGGLGIFLIRQLTDRICYQRKNGKNIMTIFKKYSEK